MESLEGILASHPFFSRLEEHHVRLLAGCASNVRFPAGEFVFREGEPANHFYLIREGKISLEISSPGSGALVIETLEAGDIVGWSWLFAPYRWRFDGRAVMTTRALALDGACLRDKSEQDHELALELYKRFSLILAERLQATRLQLLNVYEERVR